MASIFRCKLAVSLREDTWNPERFNALELAWFQGYSGYSFKRRVEVKPPPPPEKYVEDNTQTGSRYKYISNMAIFEPRSKKLLMTWTMNHPGWLMGILIVILVSWVNPHITATFSGQVYVTRTQRCIVTTNYGREFGHELNHLVCLSPGNILY